MSLPEAAAKIDPSILDAFLIKASESYASQPDIQLMRFADYFGRALSSVSSVQFPWVKMFKESPLSNLIDNQFTKHQSIGSTNVQLRLLDPLYCGRLIVFSHIWQHIMEVLPKVGRRVHNILLPNLRWQYLLP